MSLSVRTGRASQEEEKSAHADLQAAKNRDKPELGTRTADCSSPELSF